MIYISRAKDIATRKLGDETIVMSVRSSRLFTLNESATQIWDVADGQHSIEQIVHDVICEQYEVDYDTALQDAVELVQKLANDGLLLTYESSHRGANKEIA